MFSENKLDRIVKCCWVREACAAILLMGSIAALLVAMSVFACSL